MQMFMLLRHFELLFFKSARIDIVISYGYHNGIKQQSIYMKCLVVRV